MDTNLLKYYLGFEGTHKIADPWVLERDTFTTLLQNKAVLLKEVYNFFFTLNCSVLNKDFTDKMIFLSLVFGCKKKFMTRLGTIPLIRPKFQR